MLHAEKPPSPASRRVGGEIAVEFGAFCERWQLTGMVTWDLPQPRGANLGGPAAMGSLMGLADRPTIELPTTLKLPVRYPLRDMIHSQPDGNLAEWQAVMEQRHPSHFNYARWRRVFQLHFYRNICLASRYADRFPRRVAAIDWAFADYLGDASDESVRKLRRWIDGRVDSVVLPV